MKRALILIVSGLLLAASVPALAGDKPIGFNPAIHNADNLPEGILYMERGKIYLTAPGRIVMNDATYPLNSRAQVFSRDGLKISRKQLKKGQTVDLYANDRHEAVYIVLK